MMWMTTRLEQLCAVRKGTLDPQRTAETEFELYSIPGFDQGSAERKNGSEIRSVKTIVAPGDVLFSKLNPRIPRVWIVPPSSGHTQLCSTEFVPLVVSDDALLHRPYLRYFLLSSSVRDRLVDSTEAATKSRSRIRPEDVLQLEIPLPPIGEQRRIALILDQADELRKLHERADAKAEAIIPALFLKLFGDPLALTSSRDAVTVGQLKIQFQNGFACGEKDVDGGIPHLRMNNINDSGTLSLTVVRRVPADREQERYRLRTGDVLFMSTNSEDKVGKACVFYPPDNGSYLFSNHLIRLRIAEERLSPEYLATYLHLLWRRGFFRSVAKRWVNQATVSANALRQVRVHVPREGTAEEFSHQARALLTDSSRRETQRTQVERLFAVLSGRAFRGELTGKWREAHMSELLLQMEQQTRVLSTTGARGASA